MQTAASTWSAANAIANRTPIHVVEIEDFFNFTTHPLFDYQRQLLILSPAVYYRLGESSGTTAADISGSALDATYVNSPTLGVAGSLTGDSNTAVTLDGTTHYITRADHATIDLGDRFWILAWIKIAAIGARRTIVNKGTGAPNLYIATDGKLTLAKRGTADIVASTVAVTAGVWTFVAALKYDGDVYLMMDGADVTGTVTNQTCSSTASALEIGRRDDAAEYFNGDMDEVALIAAPFTDGRSFITALYHAGLGLSSPLAGYYAYLAEPPVTSRQEIEAERGRRSLSTTTILLSDPQSGGLDQATSLMMSQEIYGRTVVHKMGFSGVCYNDFLVKPGGVVDNYRLSDDLRDWEISVRDAGTLMNRTAFAPARTKLRSGINDVATAIPVEDGAEFQSSGFIRIDDEYLSYNGVDVGRAISDLSWNCAAYGNSRFVALASETCAISTDDGKTWAIITGLPSGTYNDVCWASFINSGLGGFVTVGASGLVLTSNPEGTEWTTRTAAEANTWRGICSADDLGLLVAVSRDGTNRVMTSTDGITWTSRSASEASTWEKVCYNIVPTHHFVAVAETGTNRIMYSDNGTTGWTSATVPDFDGSNLTVLYDVVYGQTDALFCAVGYGAASAYKIVTSPDGVTWTQRTATITQPYRIEYDNFNVMSFAVLDAGGGAGSIAMNSADGITWADATTAVDGTWRGIAQSGAGTFVGVGSTGTGTRNCRSTDGGSNWTTPISVITATARGVTLANRATTAASHSSGAGVQELITFTETHPVALLNEILTSTDKRGIGIDTDLIDTAWFTEVEAATPTYNMVFIVDASENIKEFIEREIFQPLGYYSRVTGDGKISFGIINPQTTSVFSITEAMIKGVTFDRNSQSAINVVEILMDYDGIAGQFLRKIEKDDAASIALYGRRLLSIQSHGLRTYNGGDAIADGRAEVLLSRYASGVPLVTLDVLDSLALIEPGDIVDVTSRHLPSKTGQDRGVVSTLMEVVSRTESQLQLHWIGYATG